jgi:hypothetical protein
MTFRYLLIPSLNIQLPLFTLSGFLINDWVISLITLGNRHKDTALGLTILGPLYLRSILNIRLSLMF